jgi:hypothetical protein
MQKAHLCEDESNLVLIDWHVMDLFIRVVTDGEKKVEIFIHEMRVNQNQGRLGLMWAVIDSSLKLSSFTAFPLQSALVFQSAQDTLSITHIYYIYSIDSLTGNSVYMDTIYVNLGQSA